MSTQKQLIKNEKNNIKNILQRYPEYKFYTIQYHSKHRKNPDAQPYYTVCLALKITNPDPDSDNRTLMSPLNANQIGEMHTILNGLDLHISIKVLTVDKTHY